MEKIMYKKSIRKDDDSWWRVSLKIIFFDMKHIYFLWFLFFLNS